MSEVLAIVGQKLRRDLLIEYLHQLQDHLGCLPKPHLAALAECLKLSQTEVFEVATFYHHFDVVDSEHPANHDLTVRVCNGPSCCMAGAEELIEKLPALLGSTVRVQAVPCIGRCEQAPAVAVGQHEMGWANHHEIMEAAFGQHTKALPPRHTGVAQYKAAGGYQRLHECVTGKRTVESLIDTLSNSGLRGLGGAGFPAGKKWAIVREQNAPRLLAVNIDEGEPGTFKDRSYLEHNPHQFLEGMLIAAWAVQASNIYIYLRDEYHACRAMLQNELALLKANPPISNMPAVNFVVAQAPTFAVKNRPCWSQLKANVDYQGYAHLTLRRWACSTNPHWFTTLKPCTGCPPSWKRGQLVFEQGTPRAKWSTVVFCIRA